MTTAFDARLLLFLFGAAIAAALLLDVTTLLLLDRCLGGRNELVDRRRRNIARRFDFELLLCEQPVVHLVALLRRQRWRLVVVARAALAVVGVHARPAADVDIADAHLACLGRLGGDDELAWQIEADARQPRHRERGGARGAFGLVAHQHAREHVTQRLTPLARLFQRRRRARRDQEQRAHRIRVVIWRLTLRHVNDRNACRPDVDLARVARFVARNNFGREEVRCTLNAKRE